MEQRIRRIPKVCVLMPPVPACGFSSFLLLEIGYNANRSNEPTWQDGGQESEEPMAEQTITLTLPDDLYRRFQEHAALKQRSLEEEVLSLATSALAEDQLPRDIQQAIADLTQLDGASLWQTARTSHLTQEQSEAIEELLFKQQREGLTVEEKVQLEQL